MLPTNPELNNASGTTEYMENKRVQESSPGSLMHIVPLGNPTKPPPKKRGRPITRNSLEFLEISNMVPTPSKQPDTPIPRSLPDPHRLSGVSRSDISGSMRVPFSARLQPTPKTPMEVNYREPRQQAELANGTTTPSSGRLNESFQSHNGVPFREPVKCPKENRELSSHIPFSPAPAGRASVPRLDPPQSLNKPETTEASDFQDTPLQHGQTAGNLYYAGTKGTSQRADEATNSSAYKENTLTFAESSVSMVEEPSVFNKSTRKALNKISPGSQAEKLQTYRVRSHVMKMLTKSLSMAFADLPVDYIEMIIEETDIRGPINKLIERCREAN